MDWLKCTEQNVNNQNLTQVSQLYIHVSFCLKVIRSWHNLPTCGHGHVICMLDGGQTHEWLNIRDMHYVGPMNHASYRWLVFKPLDLLRTRQFAVIDVHTRSLIETCAMEAVYTSLSPITINMSTTFQPMILMQQISLSHNQLVKALFSAVVKWPYQSLLMLYNKVRQVLRLLNTRTRLNSCFKIVYWLHALSTRWISFKAFMR